MSSSSPAPLPAAHERLACIGGGPRAGALIAGLVRRGFPAAQISVADPSPVARERLAQASAVRTFADNSAAVADAGTVILAVKPQQLKEVSAALAPLLAPGVLLISIAAGIPYAALRRWYGEMPSIVRTMPNQPALAGCGVTGLYAPAEVQPGARARAEAIMAAVGSTVWVEEEAQMDVVTALSGSGPAYFYRFMELLAQAATARGLPPALARTLAVETAFGAAQLARSSDEPLAELGARVTSRGGTTAAALEAFDAGGFERLVATALEAAVQRAAQLTQEHAR
jgi:pyrroline-5-carboxylate reductase